MPPTPDPPVTPTLAARLSDDVLLRAMVAFQNQPRHGSHAEQEAAAYAAMRAVLVAALTPEPVTPPVAVAVPEVLGVNDFEDRVRHLLPDGVVPSADQMRRELIAMGEPQPAPSSVPVPADDERGLAVDLLDVDRLRLIADSLVFGPRMRALRDLADRLAAQITETLSLRDELRRLKESRS